MYVAPNRDLFVTVLLDRSGSMEHIREHAVAAFNAFADDLRADAGRTLLTLTQFDSESIDTIHDAADVRAVGPLTAQLFRPRGMTPLYDAIGTTLAHAEQRLSARGWEGKVLVAIVTDGLENASVEWTRERVFKRVKELELQGWAFLYLGAHADAYAAGAAIGVASGSTARWQHSGGGAREMAAALAKSARSFRGRTHPPVALIDDEDRRKMERPER